MVFRCAPLACFNRTRQDSYYLFFCIRGAANYSREVETTDNMGASLPHSNIVNQLQMNVKNKAIERPLSRLSECYNGVRSLISGMYFRWCQLNLAEVGRLMLPLWHSDVRGTRRSRITIKWVVSRCTQCTQLEDELRSIGRACFWEYKLQNARVS